MQSTVNTPKKGGKKVFKKIFYGSKYPTNILFRDENKSTACWMVNQHMIRSLKEKPSGWLMEEALVQSSASFLAEISVRSPGIFYYYYLKKYFPDQSIQKNISFNFEKGSTGPEKSATCACTCWEVRADISIKSPWEFIIFISRKKNGRKHPKNI